MTLIKIDDYFFDDALYYERNHIWVRLEDTHVRIGISDFMQRHVGRIVAFTPRRIGTRVVRGGVVAMIESAKWVGPIKSPVGGVIIEVNEEARRNPMIIHEEPYGKGWLIMLKPEKVEEEIKLLLHGDRAIKWYSEDIKRYKETGELPKI